MRISKIQQEMQGDGYLAQKILFPITNLTLQVYIKAKYFFKTSNL